MTTPPAHPAHTCPPHPAHPSGHPQKGFIRHTLSTTHPRYCPVINPWAANHCPTSTKRATTSPLTCTFTKLPTCPPGTPYRGVTTWAPPRGQRDTRPVGPFINRRSSGPTILLRRGAGGAWHGRGMVGCNTSLYRHRQQHHTPSEAS